MFVFPVPCWPPRMMSLVSSRLLRSAEKNRVDHGFNPGCHLLGRDAIGALNPAARGSKNSPGCGGRQQRRIGAGSDSMMGKAFLEQILDNRDDGALKRHPSQLTGAPCGFSKVVTDAQCNGAQRAMAVSKGDGSALYQIAEAGFCHGLQQRVLVRIMQVKGGPVQGRVVGYLLDGNVIELLFHQ